jgi:magnesium transporter
MLVNCCAYEDGRRLADITVAEISDYLLRPGCFVWVALKDPEPQEMTAMQEEFDLHDLAVEDAMTGHQRPKIEEYGSLVFTAMHVTVIKGSDIDVGELDLFVGSNFVLSVRHRFEPGFQAVRDRAEGEPHLLKHGAGFVFYALMDNVVDRYFPVVEQLESDLEDLEERIFTENSPRKNIEQLYDLKHKLRVMRHAVDPMLEVLHKLYGGRVPLVCVGLQDYFRDVYDHLTRVNLQLEGLREMVTTATAVNLAMINQNQGEVTKRLAAYAALVAVPTMIAGIYGMNFDHMPELKWAFGYPVSVGVMVVIDLLLWRRFKKAGWL